MKSRTGFAFANDEGCRYISASPEFLYQTAHAQNAPNVLYDVPYGPVRNRMIFAETADAFFEAICKGNKAGTVLFQQEYHDERQCEEAKSSTVFAADGTPVKAIISMFAVTEKIEK